MKLPAVAIAAAFACGILLGLHAAVARNAMSLILLSSFFAATTILIFTGIFIAVRGGARTADGPRRRRASDGWLATGDQLLRGVS
jgi:hypothetical protein